MSWTEGIAWLLVVLPALRVLARPPVSREVREHPGRAAVLAFAAALIGTIAWWAIREHPVVRLALLAMAALANLGAWLRARPSWGVRRGLPPGSLGVGLSLDVLNDETFYEQAASRCGPVFKMSQFHRPVVCITDLSRGMEFLATQSHALRQAEWGFNPLVPGGYVEFMNGGAHESTWSTLAPGFSAEVLGAIRPELHAIVLRVLCEMEARSAREGKVDPAPFMDRIAFECVMRLVLGVTVASPRFAGLQRDFGALIAPIDSVLPPPRTVQVAFASLVQQVRDLIDERDRGQGAPSSVLGRVDHARRYDPTIVGNLVLLTSNGREILARFLLWTTWCIARQEAWISGCRARAAGSGEPDRVVRTEAMGFVLEVLRLHGTPFVYRTVASECRLGEWRIPRGWLVRLCIREGHLSPQRFADPHTFDPRRWLANTRDSSGFLPFGPAGHTCPAEPHVLEVATAVVAECVAGLDARVVNDGPPVRGNRHWSFWRPSPFLRLQFSARSGSRPDGSVHA